MNKPFQIKDGLTFKKNQQDRVGVIVPDIHAAPLDDINGGVDNSALNCLIKSIKIIKPDFITYIGDLGEWSSVNHYEWDKRKRPLLRDTLTLIEQDKLAVNEVLDKIDNASSSVVDTYLTIGNHDEWLNNLCSEVPQLKDTFTPQAVINSKQRNYKCFEHGRWVRFGKLYLSHGTEAAGANYCKAMLLKAGASVMFGHTHSCQSSSISTLGGYHKAWSIGCISNMDKPFLRGKTTNWQHAFAILHVHRSGYFSVEVIDIINGVCWVYGQKVLT
jgi:hypothetical protein